MKQILLTLSLFWLCLPSFAQAPSAMISSLNGSALVITPDQKAVAQPMMSLAPKTLIELREGASMSIVFFSRGSHERFQGPALIGVGQNRAKVFKGDESLRTVVGTGSPLIRGIDPQTLAALPPARTSGQSQESDAVAEAAQREADQMRAAHPTDTTPHVLMHTMYLQMGDHEKAGQALIPAMQVQPGEDAFVDRLNVMGKQINRKADQDTAGAQAFYAAEDNWSFAPFWNPGDWYWSGWDD